MSPEIYLTVAHIRNDSGEEMRIYLEPVGQEIVLSPGHKVELLAELSEWLLPLVFCYSEGGVTDFATDGRSGLGR